MSRLIHRVAVQRDDEEPGDRPSVTTEPEPAVGAPDQSPPASRPAPGEAPAAPPETTGAPSTAGKAAPGDAATSEPPDTARAAPADTAAPDPKTPAVPAGPSFARDPGLEEAPAATAPAPREFKEDPAAKLPAREAAPDLAVLNAEKRWWGDASAEAWGQKLADEYARRGMKDGTKVVRDDKLTALERDLDDVIKGWLFGRTRFAVYWQKGQPSRWDQLPGRMAAMLQARRAEILRELKAADAKLAKDRRRGQEELDAALELRMQRERHELVESLRRNVALAIWAWMVERREKLDFETIKQSPVGAAATLGELLTTEDMRRVIREILAGKKLAFSDADREAAIRQAEAAHAAAAKRAKTTPVPMTDVEKESAVAAAEYARLKQRGLEGELKNALIAARTTKDEANLVVPTKSDVKGWDTSNQVRIHKDVVALLKVLEGEFPSGFRAQTYKINIEGDHGSAGFQGRYRSLDMYPNATAASGRAATKNPFGDVGFFGQQLAYDFALAIDRAVQGRGTFQILYNDFRVARELNKVLKNGRVMNIDNVTVDGGGASNLNWHGPLVTHFHVDFAI